MANNEPPDYRMLTIRLNSLSLCLRYGFSGPSASHHSVGRMQMVAVLDDAVGWIAF
jgi:hypothetical protein